MIQLSTIFISLVHLILAENQVTTLTWQELSDMQRKSEEIYICPRACYVYNSSRCNHFVRADKWCRCPVRTINLPAADRNEEPLAIGRPPITTDDVKTPQQFFEVSLIFLIHFFKTQK